MDIPVLNFLASSLCHSLIIVPFTFLSSLFLLSFAFLLPSLLFFFDHLQASLEPADGISADFAIQKNVAGGHSRQNDYKLNYLGKVKYLFKSNFIAIVFL